jgi:endonuclease YncB( thermonuclease family)
MIYDYLATVLRVVDGDTLWMEVDLGFRVRMAIDVRLSGLNAPEAVKMVGTNITDPVITFIQERVMKGRKVIARITKAEKWGRWLAEIIYYDQSENPDEIIRKGKSLNAELIAAGLATPYDGGKK